MKSGEKLENECFIKIKLINLKDYFNSNNSKQLKNSKTFTNFANELKINEKLSIS